MLECPFCDYHTTSAYGISLHVETLHSDDDESPFATKDHESWALALALQREEEGSMNVPNLEGGSRSLAPSAYSGRNPETELQSSKLGTQDDNVRCSCPSCGKSVLLIDYDHHLDIHASLDETYTSHSLAKMPDLDSGCTSDTQQSLGSPGPMHSGTDDTAEHESSLSRTIAPFLESSSSTKSKVKSLEQERAVRLGKRELGPFAFEKRMPTWLHDQLKKGAPIKMINRIGSDGRLARESYVENEVSGLVPVLAQLSYISRSVEHAYFCHPSVQYIHQRRDHGGFCGYLNLQMQISYIQGARAQGHEQFGTRVPGVLDIQNMIENAWDNGFCVLGRHQTGGVKGTRKWIGTPEMSAVYSNLGIGQQSNMFFDIDGQKAHERVFDFVEAYFSKDNSSDDKIRTTMRAPIYFQQPGHSLTIVGLERHKDGSRNILVFDPGLKPSRVVLSFIGKKKLHNRISSRDAEKELRDFRRASSQLSKYDSFETLSLPTSPFPVPT